MSSMISARVQREGSTTFHPARFDHGLSVAGLYQYNAKHSPSHAVFTYSDPANDSPHDVYYADAWKNISYVAHVISEHVSSTSMLDDACEPSRPVVCVLAQVDTISYIYNIVAIMSLGYIAFPLAPRNTASVCAHLVESTGASHILVSSDTAMQVLASKTEALLKERGKVLHLHSVVAAEEYLSQSEGAPEHNVHDIADTDVTFILHSSGTTAMPKPIRITRRGLINLSNIPCFGELDLTGKRIAAHTNPAFHAMGLGTLMWPLTSGATFALYKPTSPPVMPTPANFLESWVADKCNIVFCVPVFIEAWARDPANLTKLQALHCIVFSGASISKHIGDMLSKAGVTMHPFWGSTEVGPATMFIPRYPPPIDEWEYFKISKHIKFVMQPQRGLEGIYEPLMIPTETCFPHVTNAELDGKAVFAVGDFLERHPNDHTRWRVFGRKDDQIMLSTGENVNPVPMETIIAQDPHIASALIFGRHRIDVGVLIEPTVGLNMRLDDETKVKDFKDLIWKTIEKANERAPAFARVKRSMILISSPKKPLEHTPKGTPRREVCLKLYTGDIEALYKAQESDSYAGNRQFPDRV